MDSPTALALMNLAEALADSVVLSDLAQSEAIDAAAAVIGPVVDCDPEAAAQAARALRGLAARARNEVDSAASTIAADIIRVALSTHQHPKNGEDDGI